MLTVIGHAKYIWITQFNPPLPSPPHSSLFYSNPIPFVLCTVIFMLVNIQINNYDQLKIFNEAHLIIELENENRSEGEGKGEGNKR